MKQRLLIICSLVLTLFCNAQGWEQFYGIYQYERGTTVCQTSDGGFMIAAVTHTDDPQNMDIWMVRTDAEGNHLFYKRLMRPGVSDYGSKMQALADGGFIIAGFTEPPISGDGDGYLVRIDANADTLWTRIFDTGADEYFTDIIVTDDGGFLIAGNRKIWTADVKETKGWLLKTDSSGNPDWQEFYGSANTHTIFHALCPTASGFAASGRFQNSPTIGDNNALVIEVDFQGTLLWQETFGAEHYDEASSLVGDQNNNLLITGCTNASSADSVNVVKFDSERNMLWSKNYVHGSGYKIIESSNHHFVIAGVKFSNFKSSSYMLMIDSNGTEIWSGTRGFSQHQNFGDVKEISDGFVFVGISDGYWAPYDMVHLLKTDSLGRLPNSLSTPFYEPEADVQIGPNPFTSSLTVTIDETTDGRNYSLTLYDILGRVVHTAEMANGQTTVQREQLASGTYSCVISTDDRIIWQGKVIAE